MSRASTFRTLSLSITLLVFMLLNSADMSHADSKVPKVKLSLKAMDLDNLTVNDIMAAGQLGGQLYPTEDIISTGGDAADNRSFAEAMQEWNKSNYKDAIKLLKKHLKDHPNSPWVPESMLHLAEDAMYNNSYTEAEKYLDKIIYGNKGKKFEGARKVSCKATRSLGLIKAFSDDFDGAKKTFADLIKKSDDWRDRTYASYWLQRLSRIKADRKAMANCGALALASVLEKDGKIKDAGEIKKILPDSASGHSIKDLKKIASRYGYDLMGLKISVKEINRIPLPSIVQTNGKSGENSHFAVVEKVDKEGAHLFDPQKDYRYCIKRTELFKNGTVNILAIQKKGYEAAGSRLSEAEMTALRGGECREMTLLESDMGMDCGDFSGSLDGTNYCSTCDAGGAPKWSVNMVSFNIYMTDTPLWYKSPIGPSVAIQISYNSEASTAQYEPFGSKWSFNYTSYLLVNTDDSVDVFMPDGRRDHFLANGTNADYISPSGVFTKLTKLGSNHFEILLEDGTSYEYNSPSGSQQIVLTKISDRYGQSITLGYNSSAQLVTITDALSKVTTLEYDSINHITKVTDPFSHSASFVYDGDNLVKVTDMGGYPTNISYDQNVYLTSVWNDRGAWTFYVEPANSIQEPSVGDYPAPGTEMSTNYRITITNPKGGKEEYHYDAWVNCGWHVSPRYYKTYKNANYNNNHPTVRKTLYYATPVTYTDPNGKGRITKVTFPDGGETDYTYDTTSGLKSSEKDFHGGTTYHATSYTYNVMGNISTITNAKNKTTTMTYAANGIDVTRITNGLGVVRMGYDGFRNMTSMTDRIGKTTHYAYNGYGQVTSVTDALGRMTSYTYYISGADNHRLANITRDGKTLSSYTYDDKGRVLTKTDASGVLLTYSYNDLDQVTSILYPDGKQEYWTYSTCCPKLVESYTDRSNRTTYYTYDEVKRLTEVKNPDGTVIRYEYDPDGNLTKLTDTNGNATKFSYDSRSRLTKKTHADGNAVTYTYDLAGLLVSKTNARGVIANYTYDETHNLTGTTYTDNTPGVSYVYDDYNRVTSRTDGIGTSAYTFDADSRLLTVDGPWASDTLTYSYDDIGRRTSLQQQGGDTVGYGYDTLGRLSTVTPGTRTFTYAYPTGSPSPIPVSLTRPNGSFTNYQYDALKRLTEISNRKSDTTVINADSFTYTDPDHVDLRDTETIVNGDPIENLTAGMVTYAYNNVNQLLSSTNPNKSFSYDADGNLTSWYTPDNYLTTATYDAENRLSTVTYTDSQSVQHTYAFTYSGDGLLAKQVIDGVETRFVRAGYNIVQERDSSNSVSKAYVWNPTAPGGIGGLLELTQSGQHYDYLFDGKGNVSALIDSNQNVVAAYKYASFGELLSKTGTLDQPYMFSTKMYYALLGISKYERRDLLTVLGRWAENDPMGVKGGLNLYGFVRNNPITRNDPLGLADGHSDQPDDPFGGYNDPFGTGNSVEIPPDPPTTETLEDVTQREEQEKAKGKVLEGACELGWTVLNYLSDWVKMEIMMVIPSDKDLQKLKGLPESDAEAAETSPNNNTNTNDPKPDNPKP